MIFVMKCFMMNISEKFTILEMQMIASQVLPLREVSATFYGIEIKKDCAKYILIRKIRLQQYQSVLFWKKEQTSLLGIMR